MKFATLPFCAVAYAVLSIAQVVLTHYGLITLGPVWLALTSYSAVIAGVVALDRRNAKVAINFGGAHGDHFVPDPSKSLGMNLEDLTAHITGTTGTGMTSSLRPVTSHWQRNRGA